MSYTLRAISEELMGKANKAKDSALYLQIKELVDRGLLVVEETQPIMVMNEGGGFSVQTAVKLTVKDMEYIKALESKVDRLKRALDCLVDKPATTSPDEEGFVSYKELLK